MLTRTSLVTAEQLYLAFLVSPPAYQSSTRALQLSVSWTATPLHLSIASGPSPTPALYKPAELGVVAEMCFMVSQVSTLTDRSPGAQSLHDFVDSGVKPGAERPTCTFSQELCGACLVSEASHPATHVWRGMGVRALHAAWDEMEVEDLLRTADRASILPFSPACGA